MSILICPWLEIAFYISILWKFYLWKTSNEVKSCVLSLFLQLSLGWMLVCGNLSEVVKRKSCVDNVNTSQFFFRLDTNFWALQCKLKLILFFLFTWNKIIITGINNPKWALNFRTFVSFEAKIFSWTMKKCLLF